MRCAALIRVAIALSLAVALLFDSLVTAFAQTFGPPALLSNSVPNSDLGHDGWAVVTTDGAGNWVAAWNSNDGLGATLGTDFDILVARSTDDGASWTPPAALNTNAATDLGTDQPPQLATDGAGNWVATWASDDSLGGPSGYGPDILFARSTDNGATWTPPAFLNSDSSYSAGPSYGPDVTTDGAGNWVATWIAVNGLGGAIGLDGDILFSRSTDNGATWTAAAALNTNAATDSGADSSQQVSTDREGNWVAVWDSFDSLGGTIGTDRDILVARSTDDGATWTAPAALTTQAAMDSGADELPRLTTDRAGTWVAVWSSSDSLGGTIGTDADILVAHSTDDGATWTTPTAMNTNAAVDSGVDSYPEITADGAGNWVTIWHSKDPLDGTLGTDFDILVARSTDNGTTWTSPSALNTNATTDSGDDLWPEFTTDNEGNWLATWSSFDSLGGTIGTDRDILLARSTDHGATWTPPAALNTNAAEDTGGDDSPQLTTDGAGAWVATWTSTDSLGGTIGTDPDILTVRSSDHGETWTVSAALGTNAAEDAGRDQQSQVTTDGVGHWVATWTSTDSLGGTIGTDNDILFARSMDDGATWTPPMALNTNAATDISEDYAPQATTDGAGHWVATWFSYDSLGGTIGTDADILVARSSDHGATWTPPAPLNTNAAEDFRYDTWPQVTTDGAGHWVAAWTSNSSLGQAAGTDADILFARSSDDGATWTPPAAVNSNSAIDSGEDSYPQVTTDGLGTWLALWTSNDNLGGTIGTDQDILFARSTDNGASWTPPAPLNTNAATDSGKDHSPQVTSDGAGSWVATWHSNDDLGGTIGKDGDILVSRSSDDGETWTPPSPLTINAATDSVADESPQVTSDGAGSWGAIWASSDSLGGEASHGIFDIVVAFGSLCGDGTLVGVEDCDDGGVADGDCCSPACDFEPVATHCGPPCRLDVCDGAGTCERGEDAPPLDVSLCRVAPNTKLKITNSTDPAKDSLTWQWSKGEAFAQGDLAAPRVDTTYALCVYDSAASVPRLAASLVVPPSAALWTSRDPKGFHYEDEAGASSGVTDLQIRPGDAGKSKLTLSAEGTRLELPPPFGSTYFEQDPGVIAQLVNSQGACWTSEFVETDNKKKQGEGVQGEDEVTQRRRRNRTGVRV